VDKRRSGTPSLRSVPENRKEYNFLGGLDWRRSGPPNLRSVRFYNYLGGFLRGPASTPTPRSRERLAMFFRRCDRGRARCRKTPLTRHCVGWVIHDRARISGDGQHPPQRVGQWTSDAIERALAHGDSDKVCAAYDRGTHWKERVEMAQWRSTLFDDLRKGRHRSAISSSYGGIRKPQTNRRYPISGRLVIGVGR